MYFEIIKRKMNFRKNNLLLIPLFFFIACKKENMLDLFKRTGKIVKETRIVSHVRNFSAGKGKINCFFTRDTVFKVEVEAGKNLIDLIKTEVIGDTLFITNHNRCNFSRSYKPQINIYISTPDLRKIIQRGAGTIKSTNTIKGDSLFLETWSSGDVYVDLDCDYLKTHVHNSTAVYATGSARSHDAYMWHNSTFFGDNLNTDYTSVYDNTTGNFYCNANIRISATMRLNGDIIYSGNPAISVDYSGGTGKIIPK